MGLALLKAPLRWIIKFVVVHPLSSIALVVLLGVAFLFTSGHVPQPFGVQAGSNSASAMVIAKGNLPAPTATENFMAGQTAYSADLVWDSLSTDLVSSLSQQGGGKQAVQEQLDNYKQEGRLMENFTYVGGYSPGGEKSFYFYVAAIRRPELGGRADHVFFAFTVDPQGKILSVE